MNALVLSGGGARGAYEVGVVRYLREELPADVRAKIHFDYITGTSVGALNGCFLAATADDPDHQGKRLADLWGSLELERMFDLKWGTALQAAWGLVQSMRSGPRLPRGVLGGLLNTHVISDLVHHAVDWSSIGRNIARGHLKGVSVSALEVVSGHTVTFVQREGGRDYPHSEDPRRTVIPVVLSPRHALASAAIPLLFPSVEIDNRWYCDGGLRQNTPLSPALRMGATRVFVISLRHERTAQEDKRAVEAALNMVPDPFMIIGKVLDALLLDRIEYDLSVLQRINRLLELGEHTYGQDFRWVVGEAVAATRGVGYKRVQAFHLRPSRDLGLMSSDFLRELPAERKRHFSSALGRRLVHREGHRETDTMSYVLFDGQFAQRLITLGMEDAHRQREEISAFFMGGAGNV